MKHNIGAISREKNKYIDIYIHPNQLLRHTSFGEHLKLTYKYIFIEKLIVTS